MIPLAVALVLWAGLPAATGPAGGALMHSRASELGARKRGLVGRACAICRWCCALLARGAGRRGPGAAADRATDDDLELEGIDIVIALDSRARWQETDLVPNRLEAAKTVIQDFVRRRPPIASGW